ncbi:MAG: dethiobiotin synthase [Candidatus Eremiobacteraeota bacterium]|nr:dethiobiotin synthase [Candidatus Eremiobacteraeota bacterium]
MHRYFVTGTDTDVGKTRVTAALALALKRTGLLPTIVKVVQTGLARDAPGDAVRAGELAGVRHVELARFEKAADPWTAALASGSMEVHARDLADAMAPIERGLVAEGAGGIMVPLNSREHFGHVAQIAKLEIVVAVGLRLGCLNHTMLTLAVCEQMGLRVAGALLVERFGPTAESYHGDVVRALQGKLKIFGILPFAADEAASVEHASRLFDTLASMRG